MHALGVETPRAQRWPSGHVRHLDDPLSAYVPGSHCVGIFVRSVGHMYPPGHRRHDGDPTTALKVPGEQAEHDVEEAFDDSPAGHGCGCTAPTLEHVVPAGHSVQFAFIPPNVMLYLKLWKLQSSFPGDVTVQLPLPRRILQFTPLRSPDIPGKPSSKVHVMLKPADVSGAYEAGTALKQLASRLSASILRHSPVKFVVPGPVTPASSSGVKRTSAIRPELYVPASQLVHTRLPSAAIVPSGHASGVVVFAKHVCPSVQAGHDEERNVFVKFPAGHTGGGLALALSGQYDPSGQLKHWLDAVSEWKPTPQMEQLVMPSALNVPPGQSVHFPSVWLGMAPELHIRGGGGGAG